MYAPHLVPEGPHHVYIFHDPTRSRFKVGESRDPIARRRTVAREVLSWSERPKLSEYRRWTFENYYAGIHVEQAAMSLLKQLGFSPVREPDWFEVDQPTMDAVILSIDELANAINQWQKINSFPETDARRKDKPYGQYLSYNDYLPLQHWWEPREAGEKFVPIDTLEERAASKKRLYKNTFRKMPEKLAALIEAIEINAANGTKEFQFPLPPPNFETSS